ncbi:MAG: peptidylprolyl isomerase [Bacteroidetes bacterium]|nr:peptidylprolyl isomerase [Bacteroidota bacterium]
MNNNPPAIMSLPKSLVLAFLFLFSVHPSFSQLPKGKIIDQVVAVVASYAILESDIENQYLQYKAQGNIANVGDVRCKILESLLFQKLMLNQAELDSVKVTDEQVETELNRKLRYYIAQFGSEEKFVEFYKKPVIEFKEEFREIVREQKKIEQVQYTITKDIKVTPSEVKSYFNKIPADSIPLLNAEVEIGQIIKNPPVSVEEKVRVKEKLNALRERILKGEDFATLAILYSEDPGSAKKGGELGFVGRGELYPEFEAIAFNLKKDQVSDILETKAGFHIIQLIERKGDYINVRHILLQPKVSPEDLVKAKQILEKVVNLIKKDSITFEKAAQEYSDDPTKTNGGITLNSETGTTRFEMDQVDPAISFALDKMNVGEVSQPLLMKTEEGKQAYRLVFLKSRTSPHRANLKQDYDRIQQWALEDKNTRTVDKWISDKLQKTYVSIIDDYKKCPYTHHWTE